MNFRMGHRVYGLGGILFGAVTIVWHQIHSIGGIARPAVLVTTVGIAEIIGGLAIQWKKTVRFGALTLGVIFSIFSVYWILQIAGTPLVFDPWGVFGEQLSIVLGSVFVFASTLRSSPERTAIIERAAYICFGICVISFALYQLFYLTYTAGLVPTWIPPGQMFWAVATTVAFALAAVALLSGRSALLASRLLTLMLVLFGFLVWLPAIAADPKRMSNWQEFASNLAMTGTAWIVTEFLARSDSFPPKWPFFPFRPNT